MTENNYILPKSREELAGLAGRIVRLRWCSSFYEKIYFCLTDDEHEFLEQWASFDESTHLRYKEIAIDAWIIYDEQIGFSDEGITTPAFCVRKYRPHDEGYETRMQALLQNKLI
ncbi:hypothetical protein J4456_03575 [Candidatus Pacearchaeota archaeon]|nr:hypothetical protein [Candidatus Pacearchaeota archaeon]